MVTLPQIRQLIKNGEAELERLRAERARLEPGDQEEAARLRVYINSAAADLDELRLDAAALEKSERSAERVTERAAGREALSRATALQPTLTRQFKELQRLMREAADVARGLNETMAAAGTEARIALKTHHGKDHRDFVLQATTTLPCATAGTSAVAKAVAFELVSLIDAMPLALSPVPNYLVVSRSMLPSGAEPKPVLMDHVDRAFTDWHVRTQDLCADPAEETAP
jgi:hypothetical protein